MKELLASFGIADREGSLWLIFGLIGQSFFFARWFVQWIQSERKGRSEVSAVFWHLSLVGALMVLVYAIRQREPVLVLGELVSVVVFSRNIVLMRRSARLAAAAGATPAT